MWLSLSAPPSVARGQDASHPGRHFDRVIIVVLENEGRSDAMADPYIASLSRESAWFSNYRALAHPSLVPLREGQEWVCDGVRLSVTWEHGDAVVHCFEPDDADGLVAAATAALVHGRDVVGAPAEVLVRVATAVAERLVRVATEPGGVPAQ